jgi:triosephosphate isomerase
MRRRMVAGNWKMHMTPQETEAFLARFLDRVAAGSNVEILLLPPYTSLDRASRLVDGTEIGLGGQDLHFEARGAYTGAISGEMLRASGCRYVLVGHSERRHVFGDDDATVARKLRAALSADLSPILCAGEVLEERRSGRTDPVVAGQLAAALGGVGGGEMDRISIAYEPVWAIGTGETATPDQAQSAIAAIRRWLGERFGATSADRVRVLYGGSVKPGRVAALVNQPGVDGLLVGGASLDPDAFAQIVEEVA